MRRRSKGPLWDGLSVALTTPFAPDYSVDPEALLAHARWLASGGVDSVVVGGSLGEGATLTTDEKAEMLRSIAAELGRRLPVVGAVAATRTSDAVDLARRLAEAGAAGLLILPPYVYRGTRTEVAEHFRAVVRATDRPCMLYNNPIAYGTDVGPEEALALVEEHPNLTGIKESSGDVRRITALTRLLGDRVTVAVGIDDLVLEGFAAGARGWVAGLANAFPEESRELTDLLGAGRLEDARALYTWFLPLLRLDADPRFVQLIKSVQAEVGRGNTRVRAPRLELPEENRIAVRETVRYALAHRPARPRAEEGDGRPQPRPSPRTGASARR